MPQRHVQGRPRLVELAVLRVQRRQRQMGVDRRVLVRLGKEFLVRPNRPQGLAAQKGVHRILMTVAHVALLPI
jgi:hypothetical protein